MKYFYFFAIALTLSSCNTHNSGEDQKKAMQDSIQADPEKRHLDSLVKANPGQSLKISTKGVEVYKGPPAKTKKQVPDSFSK